MKKIFLTFFIAMLALNASAAGVIYYENRKPGKVEFSVINPKNIGIMIYDEDNEILELKSNNKYTPDAKFIVKSSKEAQEIILKLLDDNDLSLIELEKD